MFHQGDVQSGIALALQQDKPVVCFIRDSGAVSNLWESNWLQDHNIPEAFSRHAVCLRIEAGSEEASMLQAVYPIPETPMMLVIYQGNLKEQIRTRTSKNDFTLRLLRAINKQTSGGSGPVPAQTPATPQTAPVEESRPMAGTPVYAQAATTQKTPNASSSSAPQPSAPSGGSDASRNPAREGYMQQQARRKQEATTERERIRAQIEADKQERKAREDARKAQARESQIEAASEQRAHDRQKSTARAGCALSFRLLDGSTLRHRFASNDTLQDTARPWLEQNGVDGLFTFKLILTPQPSRALSVSDERHTFAELGLVPSASLVLVAVENFTEAFQTSGTRSLLRGGPALLWGYIYSVIAFVIAGIRTFLGLQPRAEKPAAETQDNEGPSSSVGNAGKSSGVPDQSQAGIRIRTLKDQKDGAEDQQFYNGNTLNFEPNDKDDSED